MFDVFHTRQSFVMADLGLDGCRSKFLRFHGAAPSVTGSVFARTDQKLKRQRNGQHGQRASLAPPGRLWHQGRFISLRDE
jgi:hypothetical protein